MRRIDDRVAVIEERGGRPLAFAWAGRSYEVREVLADWRERRAWWRGVLAGEPALDALEERVWRVVAGPRVGASGVFELGHADEWRLLRVAD